MDLSKFIIKLGQILLLAFFNFLFAVPTVIAQPSGFIDQQYTGDFEQAVGLTFDANGRMYVWEKEGKVWVVENGVKLPTPLIDISDEVGGWRDFGLLGVALDPNYLSNGYIYLLYIVDRHHLMNYGTNNYNTGTNEYFEATIGRITRYQATAASGYKLVDYSTRQVLLGETASDGFPNLHQSHGTGHLVFGTDGTLLASFGDGASYSSTDQGSASETYYQQALTDGIISSSENIGAYRVQLLSTYSGKIIRIDPQTGAGLPSNPFYQSSNPNSKQSKVWALGLRNPCRFSLRPGTGEHHPGDGDPGVFYIGDVGWGTSEELNVLDEPGLNFGWPKYEGMTYQPGYNNSNYAPSSHELAKLDWRGGTARGTINGTIYNVGSAQIPGPNFTGNASIGGTWYTGTDFPTAYQNTYFHADYGGDWIMNYVFDENNNPVEVKNFKSGADGIVFIGTSPVDGGLYYISGAEGNNNQAINAVRKISFAGNNNLPPYANISANVIYGPNPLTVEFNSNQSYDPDNDPIAFDWNFGDGSSSNSENPTHTFTSASGIPSSFNVTLNVSDNNGLSDDESIIISLDNTPPNIVSTSLDGVNTFSHTSQTVLDLNAVVNDAEHSNNSLAYQWITELHHNNHFHQEAPDNNPSTTTVITPVGCDGSTYFYRIILTVTDPEGLQTVFHKDIYPDCSGTNQTISFAPIPDKLVNDSDFNLSGTSSSGLPVIFHIIQGPATISGSTVSLNGTPGSVLIRAIQSGNGTYAPAQVVEHIFQVSFPVEVPCDNETFVSGNILSVVSNNGVSSANQVTGSPNSNAAQFYDHEDKLTAELDDIVIAGEQISITWKARNYTSSYPGPARLSVAESADGVNYSFNTILTTSEKVNYITQSITVASDTRFLELKNASNSSAPSPDLDVDAASYSFVICDDICPNGPEPGTPCDDGDPNTENDVILANCDCEGTITFDCPIIQANIGDSCDDGNPNTENDAINANCECAGSLIYDCPTIQANIGDSCDDGDSNTQNDIVNANCECEGTPIGGSTTVCASIIASKDDAEEAPSSSVSLGSGDLELVFDNGINGNQVVGMRFLNLNIPQGANISEAYIQFTTDATVGIDPCILNLYGQASDNAATFANTSGNISSRPKTNATLSWSPPAWNNIGEAGPAQKTINIASLIQEIVNRSGYNASSSIAIIIEGTGKRTAISFNGDPNGAPELCVTYGSGSGCPDDDNDGVCNDDDICSGYDDNLDADNDGIPDGCDDDCPNEITVSGNIITVASNDGVSSANQVTGSPNSNAAQFYDHEDKLTAELDDIVIAGEQISITWKARNYTSSYPGPARLSVAESADGVNYTFNTILTTSEKVNYITQSITLASDTRFLELKNASTSSTPSPDLDVDAASYSFVICDDICPNGPEPGTPCNDGDPNTGNDVINANCECAGTPIGGSITSCASIITSRDDAEEAPSGSVNVTSGDLELVFDNGINGNQVVGMRFVNLNIPYGATISEANIQFTTDATIGIDPCVLNIYGQASDNASTFANTNGNISTRPKTSAIVSWSPPAWNTTGEAGSAQQTVNIASLIQEIVNRSGYTSSSSIVIIIDGTGKRSAISFNGAPNSAPELCVTYGSGSGCPDDDNDGVCNDEDLCPEGLEPGTPCNDGNPATFNDEIDSNCQCIGETNPGLVTTSVRISSSSDDAEEKPLQNVNTHSTDLEMVRDNDNIDQTIGLRFLGHNIPKAAQIASAYIQFTVDDTGAIDPCELDIYGQASDNPITFLNTVGNITSRPRTNASINWVPDEWVSIGDAGAAQKTVDISAIIQEIVNRGGYTSNSAIAIIIDGAGKRSAMSYDLSPNSAPQLIVTFNTNTGCPDSDGDGTCDENDLCPGGPEPGTPCGESGPGTVTLIDADFETGNDGFTSQNSGGDNWERGNEVEASSQYWTVPDNGSDYLFYANDDECNCNMSNVKLISPSLDLSSFTSATLTFDVLFEGNTYQGITEKASVEISIDNGPFNLLATINGINSNWRTESVDLSSFAGLENIRIAFRYSDGGGWLYGAAIDNVLIEGETSSIAYEIDANCECNPVSNTSGYTNPSGGQSTQGVSANFNSEENYRELELGLEPIHVFPNPTVNHLNVSFTGFRADQVLVQIMDRTGKIRYQDKRAIIEGQNVLLIKDLNLEEGLFFIQLYYNNMYRSAKFTIMDTK